jgi:hypothetical protein
MPYFAKGDGVNAAAEFTEFARAVGDPAAHLLAELVRIHNRGNLSNIPTADKAATKVRGLNCRRVENWAVFYAADSDGNHCRITVVHVGNLTHSALWRARRKNDFGDCR